MFPTRSRRVAQQLQQEIAMIIHQELKDPRLGFVTITGVVLSSDGSHAKVLFSCLGDAAERARSQEALDHGVNFIYTLIKKRLRLRITPTLVFCYDESIAGGVAISEALDRLTPPPHRDR